MNMNNIDVYIKCYYPNAPVERFANQYLYVMRNRCLSASGCKLIWEYLISDAHFNDFLFRKIKDVEDTIKNTGQMLSKLYVDVFYSRGDSKLLIDLDVYTNEGGNQSFKNDFEIQFSEVTQLVNTVKKGQALKEFLMDEIRRVDSRISKLLLTILFLTIVLPCSIAIYAFESSSHELLYFAASLFLPLFGARMFPDYCINHCSPKETEFWLKLKI